MVGIPWEQHVAFLDERGRSESIVQRVREGVRFCAGHRAVLCYAVGNEIPGSIVRWYGRRRVERFLAKLYLAAKSEDPEALVTYVNYPSTEYLDLRDFDVVSFNVFLESEATYESYLARLQNLAGDRPLLVTEAGLDSRRHGERFQADALKWQVQHAFATGAAGVFVFSWTDEWHRGGHEVVDWDFGIVDRRRRPKLALSTISDALAELPFSRRGPWPRISVIVCTHDGERTLPLCLDRLLALAYPNFEVIVVNDGSNDRTEEIARRYDVTLVNTEHRGLAFARNAGAERATGEIVTFLDDDAYPDPDWLHYIAAALMENSHAGIGGPNIPPPDDGLVADCVAAAPGGPIHVLVTDREAEHVPGCNMAFRRSALEAVGGFDEQFRVAGDDVDICWRLQNAGFKLGFSAGAVVMHRRRDSVRRYLRQQYAYGKAEALLERKWSSRYNRAGYLKWSGRIYAGPVSEPWRLRRSKVHYGTWGSGLFQSVYEPAPGRLYSLLLMPEAYLVLAVLGVIAAMGALWAPLLAAVPAVIALAGAIVGRAIASGWRAHAIRPQPRLDRLRRRALTSALYVLQPVARLAGRLRNGLSPWRRRASKSPGVLRPRTVTLWSEHWRSAEARLKELEDAISAAGGIVRSGGPYDRWDLHVQVGPVGGARLRAALEEHGSGKQLLRMRVWPRVSAEGWATFALLALLAGLAGADGAHPLAAGIGVLAIGVVLLAARDCNTGTGLVLAIIARKAREGDPKRVGEQPIVDPLDRLAAQIESSGWRRRNQDRRQNEDRRQNQDRRQNEDRRQNQDRRGTQDLGPDQERGPIRVGRWRRSLRVEEGIVPMNAPPASRESERG
jgi:GT2 family glycosyltransferase